MHPAWLPVIYVSIDECWIDYTMFLLLCNVFKPFPLNIYTQAVGLGTCAIGSGAGFMSGGGGNLGGGSLEHTENN